MGMFNAVLLTYLGLIAGRVLIIYHNGKALDARAGAGECTSNLPPMLPRFTHTPLSRSYSPARALTHAYACRHI